MTSSSDVYARWSLLQIDVFEPDLVIEKTHLDLNGGTVKLGDT